MIMMISFLFLNCACPKRIVITEGYIRCGGEWTPVFTEIGEGEFNNLEDFMTKEQFEKKQIKLDSQEFKKK